MEVRKNEQELQTSYKLQNAPCKPLFLQGIFLTLLLSGLSTRSIRVVQAED